MTSRSILVTSFIALISTFCSEARSAEVRLNPPFSLIALPDQTVELHLFMDFTDEPTLGGGLDFALSGPLKFQSFTASDYFNSLDPSFSGSATDPNVADNDLAIWFGDFNGLDGIHDLGVLSFFVLGSGTGTVDISINSLYGPFQSAVTFNEQAVTLTGATVEVSPVPLPGAAWLLISGLGAMGAWRRRAATSASE